MAKLILKNIKTSLNRTIVQDYQNEDKTFKVLSVSFHKATKPVIKKTIICGKPCYTIQTEREIDGIREMIELSVFSK